MEESGPRPPFDVWSFRSNDRNDQAVPGRPQRRKPPPSRKTWGTACVLQLSGGSGGQGLSLRCAHPHPWTMQARLKLIPASEPRWLHSQASLWGPPLRLCETSFVISQLPWLRHSFHDDSVPANSLPFPFSSPLGPWKGRSHLFRTPGQWESPFRTACHLARTATDPRGKCNTAGRVSLLFSLSCTVALSARGLILTCSMALCPTWTPWYLAARVLCLMSLLKDPKTALQLFP